MVFLIDIEKIKKQMFFIFYTPGTFGTFLYHLLTLCDEFKKYYAESFDIFHHDKTTHKNLVNVILDFHSDDQIKFWQKLDSNEQKNNYFVQNLNEIIQESILFQPPQRIATFLGIDDVREFFPYSKKIFIIMDKKSINLVSKIMPEKIVHVNKENVYYKISSLSKNSKNKNLILSCNSKKITEYYYEISQGIQVRDNEAIFYFENFLNYENFLENFTQILKKFNLTVDMKKIEILYKKFYSVNMQYFENN